MRYQALSLSGKVIAVGKRLMDVQGVGKRILIDYKFRRYSMQGFYPVYRPNWRYGLSGIGNIIRQS